MTKQAYQIESRINRLSLTRLDISRRTLRRSSHGKGLRIARIARLASLQADIANELQPTLAARHAAEDWTNKGAFVENQGKIELGSTCKYSRTFQANPRNNDLTDLAISNEPFWQAANAGMDKAESSGRELHI